MGFTSYLVVRCFVLHPMNKRRVIIVASIAAGAFVALGTFLLLREQPGVTYNNRLRLAKGMTEAEVNAILGEPESGVDALHDSSGPLTVKSWRSGDGMVIVHFDQNGKVYRSRWVGMTPDSIWIRTLRWLHLK
jgi:hypothetical protein